MQQTEADRAAVLMQALGNQYGRLQSARGGTIAESSSRMSVYLTSLTGAVVALSFVAQASRFSQTFYVFALAVLPVVFFLGLVTYYRVLQTGVEDVIYARAMSKIQRFYSEIDPSHADLFQDTSVDQSGWPGWACSPCDGSSFFPEPRLRRSSMRWSAEYSSGSLSRTCCSRRH